MVSHRDVSVIERASRRTIAGGRQGADVAGLTDVARIIEQRLREIEGQLRGYEELARERDRLERARGELVSDDGVRPGRASATRRASRRAAGRGRRARRGANVEAITGFVTAHPGATAAEIATGTGLGRGVVYSATSRLAGSGRLRRVSRGDRQVGYELGGGDAGRSAARELESPEAAGAAPAAVGARATGGASAGGETPPVPVAAGRPAAEPARVTAT